MPPTATAGALRLVPAGAVTSAGKATLREPSAALATNVVARAALGLPVEDATAARVDRGGERLPTSEGVSDPRLGVDKRVFAYGLGQATRGHATKRAAKS